MAVADAVATEVAELQQKLPAGVKLQLFYDQSQLVRDSISSVRDAIFIGLVLACVILFLFLRDWTSSLIAGLVIPVTVAVTIAVLWVIGESFNLMTLGGLAAAIGLVIDDAIVVVENIVMHRDAGERRAEAVRKALQRTHDAAARFHHHAGRGLSAAGLGERRHRHLLPRPSHYHDRRAAHFAGPGAYLDAGPELRAAKRESGENHLRRIGRLRAEAEHAAGH